jgi:hypothetical protein
MKKIIMLTLAMAPCVDAKIMRRAQDVAPVLPQPVVVTPESVRVNPVPVQHIDQDAIKRRLDEQLRAPVESAWNDRINDLFDLATVNRELARDYFIKIREKMASVGLKPTEEFKLPVGEEPMQKTEGHRAPPRKKEVVGEPKKEEGIPSGDEPMQKGKQPAPSRKPGAPSGGPAKKIGGDVKVPVKPGVVKKEETAKPGLITGNESFGKAQLMKMENDQLMALFNEYLEKLPKYWISTATEKIEEPGKMIQVVRGLPNDRWKNNMNTIKGVIITKNLMPEAEIAKKIVDRTVQVRIEQTAKPAVTTQQEEKPKEELTEEDLVKLIKMQLAEPKTDQIGWVVSTKGNIKALDKLNHAAAMQYHDQFINLTKEKAFLKQ